MSEKQLNQNEIYDGVQEALLGFLGELEYGRAGVQFVHGANNGGVLRVNSTGVDMVKTGIMMITNIQGKRAAARSIAVSGMLHKAKSRLGNLKEE